MLQAINSSTSNNSKKIPFGYSCRLNTPKNTARQALNDFYRILSPKNIDRKAVKAFSHRDYLDVFVNEKVSETPSEQLSIEDSGQILDFCNKTIMPLINMPLKS